MHKTDLPDLPLKAGEPGFRRLHQLGKHGTENPRAEREGRDGREREREKDGQRGEYTEREKERVGWVGVKKEGEDDGRREGRKKKAVWESRKEGGKERGRTKSKERKHDQSQKFNQTNVLLGFL